MTERTLKKVKVGPDEFQCPSNRADDWTFGDLEAKGRSRTGFNALQIGLMTGRARTKMTEERVARLFQCPSNRADDWTRIEALREQVRVSMPFKSG